MGVYFEPQDTRNLELMKMAQQGAADFATVQLKKRELDAEKAFKSMYYKGQDLDREALLARSGFVPIQPQKIGSYMGYKDSDVLSAHKIGNKYYNYDPMIGSGGLMNLLRQESLKQKLIDNNGFPDDLAPIIAGFTENLANGEDGAVVYAKALKAAGEINPEYVKKYGKSIKQLFVTGQKKATSAELT